MNDRTGSQSGGQGSDSMSGQQASGFGGKGMNSFLNDPSKVDALIREGYIQQAAIGQTDQQAVRQGSWDARIPGFELTKHVLQNADDLVTKVGQTS